MSYLKTLTAAELQELLDISCSDSVHNHVLQINQQNKGQLTHFPAETSGIIESLVQPLPTLTVNAPNEVNQSTTSKHSKHSKKCGKSKVHKHPKLSQLTRSTASSRDKRKNNKMTTNRSIKKMKTTKSIKARTSRRQRAEPQSKSHSHSHSHSHPAAEYQQQPKDFYLQNLVKQSISDSVTIQSLKQQLQETRSKMEISTTSHQTEIKDCKRTELKLEQQIQSLTASLQSITQQYKAQTATLSETIASKKRLQSVVDKLMQSNNAQKQDYDTKLKTLQLQHDTLQQDMATLQSDHEKQLDLYHRAQLITNTHNVSLKQKVSKQSKQKTFKNSKLKALQKSHQELHRKCQALSAGLDANNTKHQEALRKHKEIVSKLVTEKREAMLQFQGALRKMEYMVLEKQEIAQQFVSKTNQIQKLKQKLLSQEKMLRSLRTNMQSLAHHQTKDAMQTRINMLVKLSEQWDNIQVTDNKKESTKSLDNGPNQKGDAHYKSS